VTVNKPAKPLLQALVGERCGRAPWWLMRQAGRYLPEYRRVRAQARDFIELCLSPALATEISLQPVRRFEMDAAIVFSDILLVPHALGQKLEFREGEGPLLEAIEEGADIDRLTQHGALARLDPVFETVRRLAAALAPEVALIGFAGAPWTVAAYMIEGRGSRDFFRAKAFAYRDPVAFAALIDMLVAATIDFLAAQVEAGAEVVQLFDSWAGVLSEECFERWVIAPTQRIVASLSRRCPGVPVIGFPRGAGAHYERYVTATRVTAIGLDTTVSVGYARNRLQPLATVQGNLDPALLLVGGDVLARAVGGLRRALGGGRYIFNLGHGVLLDTPPENVALLARLLRQPIEVT
jgi:uroporphyrinogen decarboxylase